LTRPEYNAGLAACSNNAAPRPSFPNLTLIGAPPPAPAVADRTTNNRNTTARPPTAAAPARGAAMNNSNNVNGRSLAFRIPELLSLAKIMEEVQPIGAPSWQRVEADYSALYPDRPRTIDSLRRKFNWMKDSKIPTGDPTMPKHIKVAKRAHYQIVDKAEITTGMSEEDEQEPPPSTSPPKTTDEEEEAGEEQQDGSAQSAKKRKAKKSPAYANRKNKTANGKGSELLEIFMMQRAEAQERREQQESQRMQSNQMLM